jgi:hypothetical protein
MQWQLDPETFRESYDLTLPYGVATLEKWIGDRGNWRLTFNIRGPVAGILRFTSNMYYFDLALAQAEVESWIALGESQPSFAGKDAKLQTDLDQIDWEPELHFRTAQLLPGKLCIVSLVEWLNPVSFWMVSLAIPFGVESHLHVDSDDRFPRWYISESVAKQETIAWLHKRGQFLTSQFVCTEKAAVDGVWLA